MRKLIVANYKMNGDSALYTSIVKKLNKIKMLDTSVVLCPPFVYLDIFRLKNKKISLGVQDISNQINHKSTGQISPRMLNEFSVKYSIVGHSERRALGENDDLINQKVKLCIESDIVPIICVGENEKDENVDLIQNQVSSAISKVKRSSKIILAYEPVWAIGTGEIPSVEYINKQVSLVRKLLKKKRFNDFLILYGGSVNEDNYADLLGADIDGFLLGGVSLRLDEFLKIVKGVDNA